jgi:hypothetical protein
MRRSILLLLIPLTGCGAIRSIAALDKAERALRLASDAGLAESSPYEATMARALLDKAREEHFEARFGTSYTLAEEARKTAETGQEQPAAPTPPPGPAPPAPESAPAAPQEGTP